VEAAPDRSTPDRWRDRRRWWLPGLGLVALGYSFGAAATTPFTVAADVMTALPVAGLAVAAVWCWPWSPTVRRPGAGPRHPYRAWVALAAAIAVWELVAYAARGSRGAHPTLSSMADALDRFYVLKAAVFFGWLCLGALVVRLGVGVGGNGARPAETGAAP
jgi:hypothetical protein